MQITLFPDVKALSLQSYDEPWETFAARLINPPRFASKLACPLVKFATFGEVRSPINPKTGGGNSLRHEANMLSISGVECDYDAEIMSAEMASMLLTVSGILAVIYTSPSHTADKPRWRVLAPLSGEYPVAARREFVGRINAALGGVLARESYVAAQSFFIGAVAGVEYEAHITDGAFVDWVGIDAVYPTNAAPVAPLAHHADREADVDTIAELRDALTTISPDDYHEWTSVGIALSSLGEEGYELWSEWSARSDKHDADRDLSKWSTFRPDRTGFASVFAKAQHNGWINPKARPPIDLAGMFGDVAAAPPPEALPPAGVTPAIAAEPRAITGSTLAFDDDQVKIFAGCTYVLDKREMLLPNGMMVGKDQFDDWYGKYSFVKNVNNSCAPEKSAWNAFVKSQMRDYPRAVSSCFNPAHPLGALIEEDGRVLVNTFAPISTKPIEGDVDIMLVHLRKLFPVQRDHDIFLSYLAALVQYPGEKLSWCPVVQGTKGNGKSWIGFLMERVIGYKYTHRPKGEDINNRFTGWMDRKLLIVLEELGIYEKRETLETLKVMVTGERMEIQGKGKDQVTGENRANFLVFVNGKDAVPIDDDERRYASLFTAQQSAADIVRDGMDAQYFNRLVSWIKSVGPSHWYHYLLNYAIADELNPTVAARRAPVTSSTAEAIHASRGSVEAEVLEMIEAKHKGFAGGWICSLDLDEMLKNNRMEKQMPRQKRRALLQSLGYDWHPALQLGRANNPLPGYTSKPVLFIKKGHAHWGLQTGAEVVRAYQAAQIAAGGVGGGLVEVFNTGGV